MMMVLARRIEQFGLFNFILIPIYHTCWLLCGNRLMNSFIYQRNTHNCLDGRGANAPNFKVLIEPVRMHLSYCLNRISQEIGAFDNKHTPIICLASFWHFIPCILNWWRTMHTNLNQLMGRQCFVQYRWSIRYTMERFTFEHFVVFVLNQRKSYHRIAMLPKRSIWAQCVGQHINSAKQKKKQEKIILRALKQSQWNGIVHLDVVQ